MARPAMPRAGDPRPNIQDYPVGEPKVMPSFQHLLAFNTIFNILRALLAPRSFVA